jgi:hypothetical protein
LKIRFFKINGIKPPAFEDFLKFIHFSTINLAYQALIFL